MSKRQIIRVYLVCDWDEHLRPLQDAVLADGGNCTLSGVGKYLKKTGKHIEIFKEESSVERSSARIFFHVPERALITPGKYTKMVANKTPYRQEEQRLPAPNTQRILQAHFIPQDIVLAALFERSIDSVLAGELLNQTYEKFEIQRNLIDAERSRAPYSPESRSEAEARKNELDKQLDQEIKRLRVPHTLTYIKRMLTS